MKRKKILLALLTGAVVVSSTSFCAMDYDTSLTSYYNVGNSVAVSFDNASGSNDFLEFNTNNILDKYWSFRNLLSDIGADVPVFEQMVPQGLAIYNDYTFISMYDFEHKDNSIICVLKNEELVNICRLPNKAHVGGIAVDDDFIWVANNDGYIDAFYLCDIVNSSYLKESVLSFNVGEGLHNYKYPWIDSVSYLTINDKQLFVGSFALDTNGLIKVYDIVSLNSQLKLNYVFSFEVPDKVQGIEFYQDGRQKYLLLSRSYGAMSSILQVFRYDEGIDLVGDGSYYLTAPSMMEQITIDGDGLQILFESCANSYSREDEIDKVCTLDCKKLVKQFNNNKKHY